MPFIRPKLMSSKVRKKDIVLKNGLSATVFEDEGVSYKGEWKNNLKHGELKVFKSIEVRENVLYTARENLASFCFNVKC